MIDLLRNQLQPHMSREEKANILREFLQVLVLKIIYDKGYFKNLVFVGGTALRLLYDLRRFSEDLGFSLIDKRGYGFRKFITSLERELKQYGLDVEIKAQDKKTVQTAMIKFKDILYNLGLSKIKEEKIFVKIEIDANPPAGWNTEMSLVNKSYMFTVTHFDIPSLYATKLHACFFRRYTKGRDFYDLMWYLDKKNHPNFKLLNNAISQTEKGETQVNADNFKEFLLRKLSEVDFNRVRNDVARFLQDKKEAELLNKETLIRLVK